MIKKLLDYLEILIMPEKERKGYELQIRNKKEKKFSSIRVSSIKEAVELVGYDRYDHNLNVVIYNLDTHFYIKIHDHTSGKYLSSD